MRTNIYFLVVCFFIKLDLNSQNYVTTYAGSSGGLFNGDSVTAKFNNPVGICTDRLGNFYITEAGNNTIRKIDKQGNVTTYAGAGIGGYLDGNAATARFNQPWGICVDDSLNLYVSDFMNQRIRKISVAGIVSTLAGTGVAGLKNGKRDTALFNYPRGITLDKVGNIYIADSWNHRIRKIDTAGFVSTYAGNGLNIGSNTVGSLKDSICSEAAFYTPTGLAWDTSGNLYVADAYNHAIRKIDKNCTVTTVVGGKGSGPSGGDFEDGGFSIALLNTPTELLWDRDDNALYFSEIGNQRIRKINFGTGQVSTAAGTGNAGNKNARVDSATFDYPRGMTKRNGTIYVCDFNNHQIRKIYKKVSNSSLNEVGSMLPIMRTGPNRITLDQSVYAANIRVYGLLGREIPFVRTENEIIFQAEVDEFLLIHVNSTSENRVFKLRKP